MARRSFESNAVEKRRGAVWHWHLSPRQSRLQCSRGMRSLDWQLRCCETLIDQHQCKGNLPALRLRQKRSLHTNGCVGSRHYLLHSLAAKQASSPLTCYCVPDPSKPMAVHGVLCRLLRLKGWRGEVVA